MEMTRTFHPVGQGAFYSEKFATWNGDTFTIVYDCGALPFSSRLGRKIRSAFLEGEEIDALFISHFDADHINGLAILKDHCKIRRVFLPYLNEEEKIFLKAQYYLQYDSQYDSSTGLSYDEFEELLDTPDRFLAGDNEVVVIEILPIDPDEEHERSRIRPEEAVDITLTGKKKSTNHQGAWETHQSGTVFQIPLPYEWFFIPFNYKQDRCSKAFIEALKEEGLSQDKIDTMEKIIQHKEKLSKAYKSVASKILGATRSHLNKTSMMLYSGPNSQGNIRASRLFRCHSFSGDHWFPGYLPCRNLRSGCLYTGDVSLKDNGILDDISQRLGSLLDAIGTLQIPHHGSIHNFDKSILERGNICCAIVSFGNDNLHGHPSDLVVEELTKKRVVVRFVTEAQNSIVVQYIRI